MRRAFWQSLGPGLLFSGVAIGVSHLVQSTRAGAMFGLALAGVIIAINILKYPTFRFGVDYGHVKRQSLLVGYRELGRWAPLLFCCVIIPFLPVVQGAGSATMAGLLGALTGIDLPMPLLLPLVLVPAGLILLFGGYTWLDRVNRVMLAFLILATLATTMLALPRVDWTTVADTSWVADPAAILFLIALAGFMPNPLDISVPQSLWTIEGEERMPQEQRPNLSQTRFAFACGYVLTAVLAVCFCIMGAGVMHSQGIAPADTAAGFATQIIGLYSATLGEVPAMLAAVSAFTVMGSTVLVGYDAYSRTLTSAYGVVTERSDPSHLARVRPFVVIALLLSAYCAVTLLLDDFGAFVDLATSLAFVAGPVVAVLNHLVVTRCDLPVAARPSGLMRILSIMAIVVMSMLAASYFLL